MEALRDAQSDAGVQQREVARTESERRAVIASEHPAALNALCDAAGLLRCDAGRCHDVFGGGLASKY